MKFSKILLIDDDEDDRFIFTEALRKIENPVACEMATGAREGINKLEIMGLLVPKIIFLDLNMPIINGFDCLKEIKTIRYGKIYRWLFTVHRAIVKMWSEQVKLVLVPT